LQASAALLHQLGDGRRFGDGTVTGAELSDNARFPLLKPVLQRCQVPRLGRFPNERHNRGAACRQKAVSGFLQLQMKDGDGIASGPVGRHDGRFPPRMLKMS
jgi:hypothetical protein